MLIQNKSIKIITDLPTIGYVFKQIEGLSNYYPNFNIWYWDKLVKLVPDILLNTDKPLCTVPEELFHDFSRIFINRYSFEVNEVKKGIYRKKKLEYFFNS